MILALSSWLRMDRTRFRSAASDLVTSDRGMPEMIRYVQHLVEGPEAEVVARNAALASRTHHRVRREGSSANRLAAWAAYRGGKSRI
jgi:predicted ATPase